MQNNFMTRFLKPLLACLAIIIAVVSAVYLSSVVYTAPCTPFIKSATHSLALLIALCTVMFTVHKLRGTAINKHLSNDIWILNCFIILAAFTMLIWRSHILIGVVHIVLSIMAIIAIFDYIGFVGKCLDKNAELTRLNEGLQHKVTYYEKETADAKTEVNSLKAKLQAEKDSHNGCKANLNSVQQKRQELQQDYDKLKLDLEARVKFVEGERDALADKVKRFEGGALPDNVQAELTELRKYKADNEKLKAERAEKRRKYDAQRRANKSNRARSSKA